MLFLIAMKSFVSDISLHELDIYSRVAKTGTIRECARQLNTTAGAVSKVITRIENRIGHQLLKRTTTGVTLTTFGSDLLKFADQVLKLAMEHRLNNSSLKKSKIWTLASLSFVCNRILPSIISKISSSRPNDRFRLYEVGNAQMVTQGLLGAFEVAIHFGDLEWTRMWSSEFVGNMKWGLYAGLNHPLRSQFEVLSTHVLRYPFVMPSQWTQQGFLRGDDFCPSPWELRIPGYESSTGESALEIASMTNQLVFVPAILASRFVKMNMIEEVVVADWPKIQKPMFLTVRDDVVPTSIFQSLSSELKKTFS